MSKVNKIGIIALGQGINTLVNLLFLPYMARVLDYKDYGSYGQAILIITFAGAILSAGLSQIIYVYLSTENNKSSVLSSNIYGGIVLGIIGTVLLFLSSESFASWLNNPMLGILISYYSISLIFSIPNNSFNSFLIYTNKVKKSISLIVTSNLLKIALVITAIQVYNSVKLALLGIVLSQVFLFFFNLLFLNKYLTFNINKYNILRQMQKGFPLGMTGLIGAALLYTDGIMVSKIIGVKAFALYRNGAIEVPFISTIYGAVAAIVLPEVSKLYSKQKYKEIVRLKKTAIMNTMMLTYPVLFFLVFNSHEIISAYLGVKYISSSIIFLVFNLTLIMRINDYHDILISANKTRLILKYYLIVFVINLILNLGLINLFGSIGAAISTVISLFIFAFIFLKKSLQLINASIYDIFDFKAFFKLTIVSLLYNTLLYFVLSPVSITGVKLVLFSVLYFPPIYFYLLKQKLMSREIIKPILPNKLKQLL